MTAFDPLRTLGRESYVWGMILFAMALAAATTPLPQLRNHGLLVSEDYPYEAAKKGEQGKVTIALDISSAGGHATGCHIVESSGSALLDATTCRLTLRRAMFVGAVGASDPLSCTWTASVMWSPARITLTENRDNIVCK